MNVFKILVFLIISCSTWSQNMHLDLWLKDGQYKYDDFLIKAPWQSVRLINYQSFQIDLRGSAQQIRDIDLMKVKRDLLRLYQGNQAIELFEDFEKIDYHTSGKGTVYQVVSYEEATIKDKSKWANVGNWDFSYLPHTGLAYGLLKLSSDLYQISFAIFLSEYKFYAPYHIIDKLPDTIRY